MYHVPAPFFYGLRRVLCVLHFCPPRFLLKTLERNGAHRQQTEGHTWAAPVSCLLGFFVVIDGTA